MGSDLTTNRPSAISRSSEDAWQTRIFGGVISVLGFGVMLWLGMTDLHLPNIVLGTIGGVGGLALLLGLVAVINSFTSSGSAPCPECGRTFQMLEESGQWVPRFCRGCTHYVEAKDGQLQMTELSSVVSQPLFRATFPKDVAWPDGCCVCQAPATRRVDVAARVATTGEVARAAAATLALEVATGAGFVMVAGRRYATGVPHCDEHSDGALLQVNADEQMKILFRSYPYQRAFCELNAVKPG